MANEQMKVHALKLGTVLGMAVLFVAAPISVQMKRGFSLPTVGLAVALAKSGDSGSGDSGSGNSGSGNSGSGNSGAGGHSGGSDDSGHHSGGHHSGTDDSGHHLGGTIGGTTGGGAGGQSVVKIESSAAGIEVTYADGSREEIENGRYEAKNSAGRTVVERPATQADIDRLNALF